MPAGAHSWSLARAATVLGVIAVALSFVVEGHAAGTSHQAAGSASPAVSMAGTETARRFVRQADGDCRALNRKIISLPRDTTRAAYVYDTPRIVEGDLTLAAEFATLTPPASMARRFSELRRLKGELIALLALTFRDANMGDVQTVARLAQRYEATAIRYNKVSTALGLPACASAAAPSSSHKPPPLPLPDMAVGGGVRAGAAA
jgi:hypothetical protein